MSNSPLIADLERQFSENPRRIFARLANEYRKSGNLEGAIALCREHVPKHPGYISGHIVLGQALFERGDLAEARESFGAALDLDPENLIALRHLGDIARQEGQFDDARGWYHRLLEVDPQNEDAAAQLEIMEVGSTPTPIVSMPGIAPMTGPAAADERRSEEHAAAGEEYSPISWSDINPETASFPSIADATVADPAGAPASAEPAAGGDGSLLSFSDDDFGLPPGDRAVADAAAAVGDPEVASGSDPDGADAPDPSAGEALDAGWRGGAPAPGGEPTAGAAVEVPRLDEFGDADFTSGEIVPESGPFEDSSFPSGRVEFALPSEDVVTFRDEAENGSSPSPTGEPDPPAHWDETSSAAEGHRLEDAPVSDETEAVSDGRAALASGAEHQEPEAQESAPPLITETIAQLYERQGHLRQSLEVYRQLAEQNPLNEALRLQVGRLEAELATPMPVRDEGESIRALFGRVLRRRPPSGANGSHANGLFPGAAIGPADEQAAATLAGAFSPGISGASGPAPEGRPTRAAEDELSLDTVFRSTADSRSGGNGGVSFDDFFPGAGETQEDATKQDSGVSEPATPGDDEIFHSWLDGLKK